MKKLIPVLASALLMTACSGESDFDISVSPTTSPVIKATAVSCKARQDAESSNTLPNYDVAANFAQFKGLTISFPDTTKALVIYTVEIKFTGINLTSTIAGDDLTCLNTVWTDAGEAVVGGPLRKKYSNSATTYTPATTVSINYPIYISGLPSGAPYQYSGTVTAYGYTEDSAGNLESAQAQGFVTVTWRGD